ncbi:RNA polymerase sigma factor SigK [Microbacterium nanhaiense]|uniref:RNA polymerase sigma factor SigK n=1 Tax=Microbacterium nanhaiense TaxID=1301026 RepID=A0ABQ2N0B7_9MICO|nr:ECF RNA polymerase sigma factor SigK [Microbacterium nanhaiense]GGO63802.1 RNA polymerase sigma factor SigK [Microbacterium nanhaiense]
MLISMTHGGETAGAAHSDDGDVYDALLQRIARRDKPAFAALYDQLSPRVFGLVLRIVVDRAQSEEVLQEVFLEVWEKADRFAADRGRGRAWVFMIAHRRAVDRVKSAQASVDRDVRTGRRDLEVPFDAVAEDAEVRVEGERARAALDQLPAAQREVLAMAYFDGYSQSEIAVTLSTPLGTVKTRMRDGIARLRKAMGVAE